MTRDRELTLFVVVAIITVIAWVHLVWSAIEIFL